MEREPHTRLAGECLQPLGHLSVKISIVAAIALAVLAAAGQFVAPRIASRQIEKRLTKQGGSAHAEVHAIPWPRLLFTEGDSVKIKAEGIQLPLVSPTKKVLQDLDGFNEVEIEITNSTAGPMRISRLSLDRNKGPYQLQVQGSVSPSDVSAFITGFTLPFGSEPLPIDLTATVRSEGGAPHAVAVHGSVAGLPAGPLVEALAQALAGRF
jgi:hypothetical protein